MSTYFEWSQAAYGVNVQEMDTEHQVPIGHMNRLHELYLAHAPRAQLSAALKQLVKYTIKHFAGEEAYMAKVGFAGLKSHAAIHKDLLQKVTQRVEAFSKTGQLNEEFFSFLKMWLKAHISGIDAKYGRRLAVA
jgi:hemerythrin